MSTGVSSNLLINYYTSKINLNQLNLTQYHKNIGQKEQKNQQNIGQSYGNDQEVGKNKDTVELIQKSIEDYRKINNNNNNHNNNNNNNSNNNSNNKTLYKIKDIYEVLLKLRQIKGKKANQLKLSQINTIITNLSQTQTRYFLRILTKNLRVGIKARLIQQIFQQLIIDQKQPNNKISPKSFNPMLARPLRTMQQFIKFCDKKQTDIIIADVKYDGERTIINYEKGKKIVLISRNGKQQNQKYYKIAEQVKIALDKIEQIQNIVIDAEIVAIDKYTKQPLPFQVLLTRRRKIDSLVSQNQGIDEDVQQIVYAFDILSYNNEQLYQKQLSYRKSLLFSSGIIHLGQYKQFQYPSQKPKLLQYFSHIVNRKYQGLILKSPSDFYYTNGSRIHWGKLKKGFKQHKSDKGIIDLDLVIIGADYGKGKNCHLLSSFLIGVVKENKIHPISKVGTGFTQDDLLQLTQLLLKQTKLKKPSHNCVIPEMIKMDIWIQPKYVIEVECQQYTRSPLYQFGYREGYGGISLRFPVFKRIRDDKSVAQVTESQMILDEIKKQEKL